MEAGPSHTLADKDSNQTGNVPNSADKFGYTYSVTVLTTERCDHVSCKNKPRARQRGQTCIFKNYPGIEIFDISVELKAEEKTDVRSSQKFVKSQSRWRTCAHAFFNKTQTRNQRHAAMLGHFGNFLAHGANTY